MDKVTDNLLSGIGDSLMRDIELFLINNINDKEKQDKIISLINKSFQEGAQSALEYYEKAKEDFNNQANLFQKDFHNKLFDGQDKPISE